MASIQTAVSFYVSVLPYVASSKLRLLCLFSDIRGSHHDVTVTLSSLGTIKHPIALDLMKAKGQSNKLS